MGTGTFPNGQPVVARSRIGPEDQLGLGRHTVTLAQLMARR